MSSGEIASVVHESSVGWADVFGMIIATTSVAITVLSVFVAFYLSKSYLQSIREMEEIRRSSQDLERKVSELSHANTSILGEAMLAVRAIFDLNMLNERKFEYNRLLENLSFRFDWKGRKISEEEVEVYSERVLKELSSVNSRIIARETELYWLIGQNTEKAAHLHALASAKGDFRTIDLLENVRRIRVRNDEREELLVALSLLRHRLGKQVFYGSRRYDSSKWTGMP